MIEKRNYEATARYFERRASKVPEGRRRHQLEASADLYRQLAAADAMNEPLRSKANPKASRSNAFSRRQRLIELFRRGNSGEMLAMQDSRRSS